LNPQNLDLAVQELRRRGFGVMVQREGSIAIVLIRPCSATRTS
jgi:hypothetical protein